MSKQSISATSSLVSKTRRGRIRRASVMGMMAILLPVLVILAAFTVNLAHIQVTRTELMVATDAAARAGSRTFSETQTVSAAKTVAANIAAMNTINDQPLQLDTADGAGDIQFGITTQPNGSEGRYVFQQVPTSSVISGQAFSSAFRVLGRRESGSLSGKVPLIIPGVLQTSDFSTTQEAVAMQVDRDIALVLDRSGSMDDYDAVWPSGTSPVSIGALQAALSAGLLEINWRGNFILADGVNMPIYERWVWEEYYDLGPFPFTNAWDDLIAAVDAFLDVLDTTVQEEQVSISSYSRDATLDSYLKYDYDEVRGTIDGLLTGGRTAIGLGMLEGFETLLASEARPNAAKTMVVMTDGIHNSGINPTAVASQLLSNYNLTIHTVTFGTQTDIQLMQELAAIGGGNHYHAATGSELVEVFEEIANNLPTILTQ